MCAGLHEDRSKWRHVMGLTRLLSRPLMREQETEDQTPTPETGEPPREAEVISFANQKGGVAKTTSTLNLAAALSEQDYRVLCVDMDPQGNLTMSQGLNPDSIERSMFDVLVHRLPIESVIEHKEIDLAVSSIDLAGAELALKTRIKKTIRYAEAPVKGTSVLKYDPTGNAAKAYRDLAKEVLNGAKARKHA